jgi:hypothetical protein
VQTTRHQRRNKAVFSRPPLRLAARSLLFVARQIRKNSSKKCSGANAMIRKLASGEYRLYSRKKNPKTGRRRNLGTFATRTAAEKHERDIQYFKRHR